MVIIKVTAPTIIPINPKSLPILRKAENFPLSAPLLAKIKAIINALKPKSRAIKAGTPPVANKPMTMVITIPTMAQTENTKDKIPNPKETKLKTVFKTSSASAAGFLKFFFFALISWAICFKLFGEELSTSLVLDGSSFFPEKTSVAVRGARSISALVVAKLGISWELAS